MRFDPTQPYAEVIGIPGARYEQHGRRFSPGGHEVLPDGRVLDTPVEEEETTSQPSAVGFEGMHWKQLKALMETYGQDWTNKEAAVAYLRGVQS